MGFIIFVILVIVIYEICKTWRKSRPNNVVERLEMMANKDFQASKIWLEKDIKRMSNDEFRNWRFTSSFIIRCSSDSCRIHYRFVKVLIT